MIKQIEFTLPEFPMGFHLITHKIIQQIGDLPQQGILHLFLKHTSAGLTINENADKTVRDDFQRFFSDWIPEKYSKFQHIDEGLDDMPAHIKASVVGCSLQIPISHSKLNMGLWQGIYLCEFRRYGGPRRIVATIYS